MIVTKQTFLEGDSNVFSILSGVSATETSSSIVVSGAKKISLVFTETGTVNNRSGVLKLQASLDNTTFVDLNTLIDNVSNTNVETLTRVASKTRATAGSDILFLDDILIGSINYLRAVLTITDGASPTGTFTVNISVQK